MGTKLNECADDSAAKPVLGLMAEGRWRKARDAAKDLCKRDRARYLVLLIEANVGLARDMAARGLAKDAATVVAYLETIASPAVVAALREELAKPPPPRDPHERTNPGLVLDWAAVLRADQAAVEKRSADPADLAAIDRLVPEAFEPQVAAGDERARCLAAELAAVRTACAATGEGRWDEAQEALRGVPAQSVFRHWRMFLRGVRCLFHDQPDTARQCFAGLPPNGAPARAARTFAPRLAPHGPAAPTTSRVALHLAMTGQPAAWTAPLATATADWQGGRRAQAVLGLLGAMKGRFPTTEPGLPALLTDAMLPFRQAMNQQDWADGDQLIPKWDPWDERHQQANPAAALAGMRAVCLAEVDAMPTHELVSSWRTVIGLWNRCHGPDPLRDSLAWQWLGETIARKIAPTGSGFPFVEIVGGGNRNGDLTRARSALETAVDRDPGNETAWISLLNVLDRQGDHKTRNKLLDNLARRFPDNKAILMRTGTLAVDRKAFDKGLAALHKALALDPLDRTTRERIAISLLLQIREYRRKNRPQGPLWEQLDPVLDDRAPSTHLMLSRWMARVRRALLDTDVAAAAAAAEDAVRMAPSAAERLFAERMLAGVYRITIRPGWNRDWTEVKRSGSHAWSELQGCLESGTLFSHIKEWSAADLKRCRLHTRELCEAVARDGLDDDPDGLLAFLDHAGPLLAQQGPQGDCGVTRCLRCLNDILTRGTKTKARTDPRLRLAALLIDEHFQSEFTTATPKLFAALYQIEQVAEAKGMSGAVTRVRALRERWQRAAQRPPQNFFDPWGDDEDDEDDEDEYDDDDDDDGEDVGGEYRTPEALLELLYLGVVNGDPDTVGVATVNLLDIGMSQPEIDGYIAAFEDSAAARQPNPRKPKAPPPPNPDQPDLPF
jgi:hypothetical protein